MSDEVKVEQPNEEQESSAAPPKSGGMLKTIIIAVGVFVVAISGFSFVMGVFSSTPQNADTEALFAEPDTLAIEGEMVDTDSINEDALIDQLENEIFGMEGSQGGNIDDYIGKMGEKTSMMSVKDSIATVEWVAAETKRLTTQHAELEAMKKDLDAQERRLKQLVGQVNKVESARIGALAKLYEGMKPEQVAPLIGKLSDDQAVQVLMQMKPASAAKILGSLSPDYAARISSNMITLNEE